MHTEAWLPLRPGLFPIMAYMGTGADGEASQERGTFWASGIWVGISLGEINERVEKSVISDCKRAQKG